MITLILLALAIWLLVVVLGAWLVGATVRFFVILLINTVVTILITWWWARRATLKEVAQKK